MTRHGSWPLVALGDVIFNVQSGFASGERTADGVVQLRMNNVSTDGGLDLTNHIRVPTTTSQIAKYGLQPGDVLFNSTNSLELVGKTAVFAGFSEPVVFSNHFARLRVVPDKLDPYYLAQWLLVKWQQRIFEHLATAWVNQASVRKEDLLDLHLPLPPLAEQQRIAGLLRRADRLRRLRRYALAVSAGYLQAVFVEMFGDESEYQAVELEELLREDPKNGLYLDAEKYGKGTPIIRINNFYDGVLNSDTEFKRVQASQRQISEFCVTTGDILINRVNSIEYLGKCALVERLRETTLYESNMMRVRVDQNRVVPQYLARYLSSPQAKEQVRRRARKAVNQASINQSDVKSLRVVLPDIDLQRRYDGIVRKFRGLESQQEEALRQAEHLFQALLRRVFGGWGGKQGTNQDNERIERSATRLLAQDATETICPFF